MLVFASFNNKILIDHFIYKENTWKQETYEELHLTPLPGHQKGGGGGGVLGSFKTCTCENVCPIFHKSFS